MARYIHGGANERPRYTDSGLSDLLEELYLNTHDTVPTATIDAIEHYAGVLGSIGCEHYAHLHAIMERHELHIRTRWLKKSPAQRRDVLLAADPEMPRKYQPQNAFALMPYSTLGITFAPTSRHLHSVVNLENLAKSKPLLIFIKARGRTLP